MMPRFGDVVAVPLPLPSLCTASVLTMSYLDGPMLESEARRQVMRGDRPLLCCVQFVQWSLANRASQCVWHTATHSHTQTHTVHSHTLRCPVG